MLIVSIVGHLKVLLGSIVGESGESIAFARLQRLQVLRARLQVCEFRREVLRVVRDVKLGSVRRCQALALNLLPVDALEPGMALDLLGVTLATAQSRGRILDQQRLAQVARILGQELVVHLWLAILDVVVQLLAVLGVERGQPDEHFINNRAE